MPSLAVHPPAVTTTVLYAPDLTSAAASISACVGAAQNPLASDPVAFTRPATSAAAFAKLPPPRWFIAPRDGKFTEKIGTYNPNTNPATVDLKFDRALYWVEVGAQPTDTVRNILSKEGVYMMKHLRGGVKKGAFDEAAAQAKFEAWKNDKQKGLEAFEAKKAAEKKAAAEARLQAEKKVNEEIAKKVAEKKAAEAAAKAEAEAEAPADAPAEETTETPAEA